MKVRFTRRAIDDLTSTNDYIRERSPSGAANVSAAVQGAIDMLPLFPKFGTAMERDVRRLVEPRYGYRIYYRVQPKQDTILILSIRHPARSAPRL